MFPRPWSSILRLHPFLSSPKALDPCGWRVRSELSQVLKDEGKWGPEMEKLPQPPPPPPPHFPSPSHPSLPASPLFHPLRLSFSLPSSCSHPCPCSNHWGWKPQPPWQECLFWGQAVCESPVCPCEHNITFIVKEAALCLSPFHFLVPLLGWRARTSGDVGEPGNASSSQLGRKGSVGSSQGL